MAAMRALRSGKDDDAEVQFIEARTAADSVAAAARLLAALAAYGGNGDRKLMRDAGGVDALRALLRRLDGEAARGDVDVRRDALATLQLLDAAGRWDDERNRLTEGGSHT